MVDTGAEMENPRIGVRVQGHPVHDFLEQFRGRRLLLFRRS